MSRMTLNVALSLAMVAGAPASLAAQTVPVDPVTVFLQHNRTVQGVVETPSGLQYKVIAPGDGGVRPSNSDVVLITYKGMLTDGTTFDEATQPTPMPVAEVVPGFAEGLKLMPRGATYRFWIKPELGYGETATGPIPAHSILVFDLQLLDFKSMDEIRRMQAQQQQQQQQQQQGGAPTAP
jgi:FKBP-type peptidyl-prolyl cis-trans isomerase FkpA